MRISVVIPAYQCAATIVGALDSVIAQAVTDLEIVVVDDCSPDDIEQAVETWKRAAIGTLPPVLLLRTPHNMGPAGARNLGLQAARGEWIAFLDADDVWLPNRLADQFKAIQDWQATRPAETPVFICGKTTLLTNARPAATKPAHRQNPTYTSSSPDSPDSHDPSDQSDLPNPPENPTLPIASRLRLIDFAVSNPVATSTVLARREWLRVVGGFDEQFCGPEDYDLWLRIAASCDDRQGDTSAMLPPTELHKPVMLFLPKPLSLYRHAPGSLSMDERRFLPQVLKVLDKAYSTGGALAKLGPRYARRARAHQYAGASWMAFCRGARGRALQLLAASCMQTPVWRGSGRWKLAIRYLTSKSDEHG